MTAVAIGGVNVDIIAASAGPLQRGVSNPGRIRITAGGAGRNVAENLARLGVPTRLIAAVDMHALADQAIEQTARAGVDVSGVVRISGRGSYYAAIQSGDSVEWAVSDMSAAESLTPGNIDAQASAIRAADAVIVDANLAAATIQRAAELAGGRVFCLLPVSRAKAARIRSALPRASLIVLSVGEAEVLSGANIGTPKDALRAAQTLQYAPSSTVVITMGEHGLGWAGSTSVWVEPLGGPVVDPSGGGDAVAAVAVYALLTGLEPRHAARLAMIAASMTLSVEGATHPGLSLDALHAGA
ncbi:MAG: PfkB family carbohydrate kinase [bacterium]